MHCLKGICAHVGDLGPVSRKYRELFGPEKQVIKLQSAYFEKLILQYVFNVRKPKRIAKFHGLEPLRCEDIKGIVSPKIGPKSFGTFEKQATGDLCFVSSTVQTCGRQCDPMIGALALRSHGHPRLKNNCPDHWMYLILVVCGST